FDDGAPANGSFVFDGNFTRYSVVNIQTGVGGTLGFPGVLYLFPNNNVGAANIQFYANPTDPTTTDQTSMRILILRFTTTLTDAGGNVAIDTSVSGEGFCNTYDNISKSCNISSISLVRLVSSGSVNGVPTVPTLSGWSMIVLSVGLLITGWIGARG